MASTLRVICSSHLLTMILLLAATSCSALHWPHSQQLSDDYRLLWTATQLDITFEVQARTHGFVGLGFARPGDSLAGADIVIGWVDQGQAHLQDRHFPKNAAHTESMLDPSQDYTLLLGYENSTHTVLRFSRRLEACDSAHDVPLTADTQSVFFMIHPEDPASADDGSVIGSAAAVSTIVPMQLLQRTDGRPTNASATSRAHDLLNGAVPLPMAGETLQWCRVFELTQFAAAKHHLVRYEPLFGRTSASRQLMAEIVLYECQGEAERLRELAADGGQLCVSQRVQPTLPCNAVVAAWRRGSTGLTFPPEAGFPIDSTKDRFYLMETQYSNRAAANGDATAAPRGRRTQQQQQQPQTDNSGLRLHVTASLRPHDAGVLSLGINPEWRHIIPPGHARVISEGHCVADCTRAALSAAGISIFAVLPQTRHIATQIRLRQVRRSQDLLPPATDANVHSAYAEYRRVEPAARVMPGDRLVVECTYDSSARESITLGGADGMGETCQMLAVYWPRQRRLQTCHSLPSLPTVLHSLGIEELTSTTPVLIALPAPLAGISLESRILSYDWASEFENFQRTTLGGSFQAFCTDGRHKTVAKTDTKEFFRPRVTKIYRTEASDTSFSQCATLAVVAVAKPKRHQPVSIVDVGDAAIREAIGDPATSAAAALPRLAFGALFVVLWRFGAAV